MAILKRIIADACHAVGYCDACQAATTIERFLANACNSVPNFGFFKHGRNYKIFTFYTSVTHQSSIGTINSKINGEYGFGVGVTTNRAGVCCVTFCSSGGRSNYLFDRSSVINSINNRLCNKNFVTYRTVFTFGKTGSNASRCYCLINYRSMSEFFNRFTLQSSMTNSAFLMLCADCGAGSGSVCNPIGRSVSEFFNRFTLQSSMTNGAFLMFLTCYGAGSGSVRNPFGGSVCFLCYNILCNNNLVANRTVTTFGQAGGGASCFYCLINYGGVIELFNRSHLQSSVTNSAFLVLCTNRGASSSGVRNPIGISVCFLFYNVLRNNNLVANRAMTTFGQASSGAGCFYCLIDYGSMSEFFNYSSFQSIMTNRAFFILLTCYGASSGSVGNPFGRSMCFLCYNILCNNNLVTNRAVAAFGQAGGGTSCFYCGISLGCVG